MVTSFSEKIYGIFDVFLRKNDKNNHYKIKN